MPNFKILYDEPHEAAWFRGLHPNFANVPDAPITGRQPPAVAKVLSYDRPDIVLVDGDEPVLVVEETVEVPSGHNVGQRFARIAAAAEQKVPSLYFGPYVAKKHGGVTAGPRFMNARLFHAVDAMVSVTGAAVTTVNWPVDAKFEVRRDPAKDADVRAYVDTFMISYHAHGMAGINQALLNSTIHARMITERDQFVQTRIRNPQQYASPPDSVELLPRSDFVARVPSAAALPTSVTEVVLYNIGMTSVRSDPYTGMGMLYKYLYIAQHPHRALVLWFPNISMAAWASVAANAKRKDVRLFRIAADAILFSDGFALRGKC
jgi:hypothetical protein